MKKLILLAVFLLCGSYAYGQTETPCPADKVCVSREAAIRAVTDAKTVDAQKVEIDALNKAIADYKQQLADMRVQFAEASGENTILKQQQVADRALMTVLVQNTKKKRFGLINIF